MDDNDLITRMDAARAYGVSRQAVEQAIGRAMSPPKIVQRVAGMDLYRRGEFHEWWVNRAAEAWKESRGPGISQSKQLNCRISQETFDAIAAMRKPGETMSMVGRKLLVEAVAERKSPP
jgi:hypothetical protein